VVADGEMSPPFDLPAYLRRIGKREVPPATLEGLRALHRAHVESIPFENLDIQMGHGVRIDPASLMDKLVARRRGGYCFEQNTLFAHVLEAVGIAVRAREARVRPAPGVLLPRTHMTLVASVAGRDWLADVGFGGEGLVEPAAMDGEVVRQEGWDYRVVAEGTLRVLQRRRDGAWLDQYAVLPGVVHPVDFEVANWFTSTWPKSPFVQTVTAQRVTGGARHVLRNLTYTVTRAERTETRELSRAELVPLLRSVFGLDVEPGARFVALDGAAGP
jgi:N-hydroxyarylamine O-acetyltransferase